MTAPSSAATGYAFEAPTRFDKLFAGITFKRPASLPLTTEGCVSIGPEDTFDADYGAMLEKACAANVWRPQREPHCLD